MEIGTLVILGSLTLALAGIVKGFVGLGFPTIGMGLLTLAVAPRVAIALILFPMLLINIWQVYRMGQVAQTARQYALYATILFVCVAAISLMARSADDRILLGFLGVALVLFSVSNWLNLVPRISPRYARLFEVVAALFAGVIGGLTAGWAAPMAIYLAAKQVARDEFLRATGFLITIGSIPLCLTYASLGFLNDGLWLLSLGLIVPTLLGFSVGEALRQRASEAAFRQVLLVVFFGLGLNLLRRAVFDT